MTATDMITFVSHTNKPGGGELALRRFLEATSLRVRLVTLEPGGVWLGLDADVVHARGVNGLRKALRGGGLVVANSMRAAFLTALALPRGGHLVYWVRDGLTDSAMSPLALMLTKHVTARRTKHYIANSSWTAQTVRQALRIGPDRVDVAHSMCGVTRTVLEGPHRSVPHTPLRLLFLGRISPWKAPDVAVRALENLRKMGIEATLTIAGGVLFDEAEYAARLGALVEKERAASLAGHVEDVHGLLATHDILVHCSTVPEPFGQVIVQGLAQGIPVVATNHGGPVEILQSCPTLLYEPGEPVDLARTVHDAVARFDEIGQWARLRASEFVDDAVAARTDRVLSEIQASRATGQLRSSS